MSDTAFEVRYMKRRQEAQFEPAEAEIKAVFNDNDGGISAAESKLRECREAVERVLGLKPARAVAHATVESPAITGAEDTSVAKDTPAQAEEKKRRGRPSNAELAKKAAERALAEASADPMAELLEDARSAAAVEEKTQQISTGEERVDPMADVMGDDIPEPKVEEPATEERPITDQELQNEAGKTVQRLGDANIVRKMVKNNYRVARLDEVAANMRRALVSDLRNLQKDGSIKVPEKK